MLKNPTLKMIFKWKRERALTPNRHNLIIAVEEENLDMIKYFIARGYDPDQYDLLFAIENGQLDSVKIFIKGRITPGKYALSHALRQGDPDMVEYLVNEGGAQPTLKDLQYAIRLKSRKSIVDFLRSRIQSIQS